MAMDERSYHNPGRRVFLCLGFLLLAAILGGGAAFATGGGRIALAVLAVLVILLALRTLFLRIVPTSAGLRVHGALGNRTIPWNEIQRIELGRESVNSMNPLMIFTNQWVPVAYLADGQKLKLSAVTSYTLREATRDTTAAARIAAELEQIRAHAQAPAR